MEKAMVKLDYSCHELEAKKHLKEVHKLVLVNKFAEAAEMVDHAIVELRMMKAALNSHIKD